MDEGLLGEFLQRHRSVPPRQAMVAMDHEHHRLAHHLEQREAGRDVGAGRVAQIGHLQPAGRHLPHCGVDGEFLQYQSNARMPGAIGEDGCRHRLGEQGGGKQPDHHLPDLPAMRARGHQPRALGLGDGGARLGQEKAAGFGQRHGTAGAVEQAHLQLLLQRADLLAERRLGHAEAFRGAAEVQFLGHGDEVAEVTQFHAIDTYGILISSQAILDATRRAFLDCCDATSLEGLR